MRANQIANADIGSADDLAEQGLDLRNTANKTLPTKKHCQQNTDQQYTDQQNTDQQNTANKTLTYWLLPNLTCFASLFSSWRNPMFTLHCVLFSGNHPQLRFSAAC